MWNGPMLWCFLGPKAVAVEGTQNLNPEHSTGMILI